MLATQAPDLACNHSPVIGQHTKRTILVGGAAARREQAVGLKQRRRACGRRVAPQQLRRAQRQLPLQLLPRRLKPLLCAPKAMLTPCPNMLTNIIFKAIA